MSEKLLPSDTLYRLIRDVGRSKILIVFQDGDDIILVNEKDKEKFGLYKASYSQLVSLEEDAELLWGTLIDDIKSQKN